MEKSSLFMKPLSLNKKFMEASGKKMSGDGA
jgi:hypothetical protein